jgi:hypothetical protein
MGCLSTGVCLSGVILLRLENRKPRGISVCCRAAECYKHFNKPLLLFSLRFPDILIGLTWCRNIAGDLRTIVMSYGQR